ncbi:hypothetical protein LCGC14_0237300 [marine sediment metagenome]|jgi:hypothetical protein|uniref:Uncharacterized protein n=1 Tax=marine sediment metagenome TaxID=412755 RepID=A0A0F9XCV7_9ZZZZ|tara:strand:+ start:23328 stop:23558 length:231 start_codon:yes stop_codon:yes gene_type:complete
MNQTLMIDAQRLLPLLDEVAKADAERRRIFDEQNSENDLKRLPDNDYMAASVEWANKCAAVVGAVAEAVGDKRFQL